MLETKNVYKIFEDREVLHDISCHFEPGKTNLIIGQSGSGKTVLMKCLIGLYEVDKGGILYDNRDFSKMSKSERKIIRQEMGVMFQGGALFDSMTVEENVKFPLIMLSDLSNSEKIKRVNFCLDRVQLGNAHSLYPSQLSGGMKKRVAIARAIALNPKYLFCDEPNSGLDPKTSLVIDQLISEITHEYNITTIVNTHDMNSVMAIGETISFIYEGKLWWKGSNTNVLESDNEELQDFIRATRFASQCKE
ncbi:MAG: ATP-binding cassette domain-containing protein [Bacteroidales bacterium]|jgi:phospholipid/cholesterol/gamma-HCH transport system ATP-binding protein|nr:ATP-binding cassette domain-containing protein [Bacteroidales bacterium]MDD2687739.1 ATP-binding cassette domain-containing protein [Bacteroidales bacterium]MDD3330249.1 ATP-binding cassette domain-containing protein [Bacteroidales bacterium]MDD3691008.1 ATP-binding cassette domain-containing protein [Bacteroidales bacterium]MDD4044271.1 ATP-binding cassette domain-containing protein [Bacteroidales bacterium]